MLFNVVKSCSSQSKLAKPVKPIKSFKTKQCSIIIDIKYQRISQYWKHHKAWFWIENLFVSGHFGIWLTKIKTYYWLIQLFWDSLYLKMQKGAILDFKIWVNFEACPYTRYWILEERQEITIKKLSDIWAKNMWLWLR